MRSSGLVLAVLLASCSHRDASPNDEPALTSTRPIPDARAPLSTAISPRSASDRTPAEPFARARRALFERVQEVRLPACSADGVCADAGDVAALAPTATRTLGASGRPLLYGDDIRFLLDDTRMAEAVAAVEAATAAAAERQPADRLLLQNDVWERFDALGHLAPEHPFAAASARLRRHIARLLRALALTPEEARGIASNLPEAAREMAAELGGVDEPSRWIEVRTTYRDGPVSTPVRTGTRHDMRAGHRMAFRILVRLPDDAGGEARLRRNLDTRDDALPPGTRLALLGSPLALTTEGQVVPTRLVTAVETRRVVSPPYPPFAERPFDVFEVGVDRAAEPLHLVRIPPDELIPMGATCAPTVGTLVPLRASCLMCHARVGERLTGPMAHGDAAFELEPDPEAASRRVAAEKNGSSSMRELRDAWATL